MEILQIELPDGWKEEDRGIMASMSNKANKKIGPLGNLRQALAEEFNGWKIKDSIPTTYPEKFISAREAQTKCS
jgi:hypothetical protein